MVGRSDKYGEEMGCADAEVGERYFKLIHVKQEAATSGDIFRPVLAQNDHETEDAETVSVIT